MGRIRSAQLPVAGSQVLYGSSGLGKLFFLDRFLDIGIGQASSLPGPCLYFFWGESRAKFRYELLS